MERVLSVSIVVSSEANRLHMHGTHSRGLERLQLLLSSSSRSCGQGTERHKSPLGGSTGVSTRVVRGSVLYSQARTPCGRLTCHFLPALSLSQPFPRQHPDQRGARTARYTCIHTPRYQGLPCYRRDVPQCVLCTLLVKAGSARWCSLSYVEQRTTPSPS